MSARVVTGLAWLVFLPVGISVLCCLLSNIWILFFGIIVCIYSSLRQEGKSSLPKLARIGSFCTFKLERHCLRRLHQPHFVYRALSKVFQRRSHPLRFYEPTYHFSPIFPLIPLLLWKEVSDAFYSGKPRFMRPLISFVFHFGEPKNFSIFFSRIFFYYI